MSTGGMEIDLSMEDRDADGRGNPDMQEVASGSGSDADVQDVVSIGSVNSEADVFAHHVSLVDSDQDADSDDSVSILGMVHSPPAARFNQAQEELFEPIDIERPRAPTPHSPHLIEVYGSETDSGGPSRESSRPPSRSSSRASTPQLPSRRPQASTSDTVRMEINITANQAMSDSEIDSDSESGAERVNTPDMETEAPNDQAAVASASATHDQSIDEFRSPKKVKVPSPKKSAGASADVADDDEDEGACCPICFEPWSNSGIHRLTSLKCGHLFGQSCIQKWIKGRKGKCPQCNSRANRSDIRVLYAKSLKTIDTSERDAALKELEREKDARRKAELDAAQARLSYQMALAECDRMKQDFQKQRQQLDHMRTHAPAGSLVGAGTPTKLSQPASLAPLFAFEKSMKISEAGECRVMAFSGHLSTLCISQPSSNALFPGYGVKKLSVLDFRTTQYVSIHSNKIRDVAFNPRNADSLLLSCSMDKTVRITSLLSNTVVQTYQCTMPVWSCCWDLDNWNHFYAGQQNGTVCMFDIRNTSETVNQLNTIGSKSPVASVQYVSSKPQSAFRPGGLLVGQLNRSSFFEKHVSGEYKVHALPLEGSLTSLSVDDNSRHLVASYRPTANHLSVRHQLCELTCQNLGPTDHVCSCNRVQTFLGGSTQKLLGRSKLLSHPNDPSKLFVCGGDEATHSAQVWDVTSGQLRQKLTTNSAVLDMCSFRANGGQCYLTTLTDKQVNIYKWR